jgi:hypothetical protein
MNELPEKRELDAQPKTILIPEPKNLSFERRQPYFQNVFIQLMSISVL